MLESQAWDDRVEKERFTAWQTIVAFPFSSVLESTWLAQTGTNVGISSLFGIMLPLMMVMSSVAGAGVCH